MRIKINSPLSPLIEKLRIKKQSFSDMELKNLYGRIPCKKGSGDDECFCGCNAYGDRCEYWLQQYKFEIEVCEEHTCCKIYS